jgi:D-amino peptidase
MRVIIFCDMEGVSCIETWEQVMSGTAFYQECRKLYTDEMNAAVRGARAAGASEIIVVDCHGAGGAYNFKSFVPERIARCAGSETAQLAQTLQGSRPCHIQG